MSFEATVRLKCDRCGRVLAEKTVLASPDEIKSVRWGMEHGAKGTGIMVDERVRRRTRHLCRKCADQP
jgi:hypothetical protein